MQDVYFQFKKQATTRRGAIMFAVCRGKVAEGIDFSDELCRAVFMVGVPYPPIQDKRIELK
jgi:regulator of telomere elongation helicase 1